MVFARSIPSVVTFCKIDEMSVARLLIETIRSEAASIPLDEKSEAGRVIRSWICR